MKILLTNNTLQNLAGSETWVKTMIQSLEELGHQCGACVASGEDLLIGKTIDLFDLDLAIINHNTCLDRLKYLKCKKIFTSHGVIPDLEQPVEGADIYVSVSEEVQENLKSKGFESVVIRNPIDCDKFKSIRPINKEIKKVLFSSNYQGYARNVIIQTCQELGIELEIIGGQNRVSDIVSKINEADLVIGLGRTAYEAMACERNVIIFDYNGADGFATPESLLEFRKNNCSGRRYKKQFTVEDLKNEFKKYSQYNGKRLREYILENNNAKKIVKQYLEL